MSSTQRSYATHASSIGTLLMVGSPQGAHYLTLLRDETAQDHLQRAFVGEAFIELPGFFNNSFAMIDQYLAGNGPLTLPYNLQGGTPLQRAVWLQIAKIPYGETINYSMLAERVGFPRAVRAVASACGANPLPLLIPCHRIIAKDGTLGGFSLGGLDVKEQLLALESRVQNVQAA